MNDRERFHSLFRGEEVDRIPSYFFGTWRETKERWVKEGLEGKVDFLVDYGPQIEGMDEDWEKGMWDCHGFVSDRLFCDGNNELLEENDDYKIIKYPTGAIVQHYKKGSSISNVLKETLQPDKDSWNKIKECFDPDDKRRYSDNWQIRAEKFSKRTRVATFICGSLYGTMRSLMGIEELSILMYEDPKFLDEMLEHFTDFYIKLLGPVAQKANFDFGYIFEDCCGANGPLFSPEIYKSIFDKHYKKLIKFYKNECNIPFILLDSDGKIDPLVPCWLDSGIDIIFPLEVGKWEGSPIKIREKFGKDIAIMGGINKHFIPQGKDKIYSHLKEFKPAVLQGKYLPMPDHRIPPDVSLNSFKEYVSIFKEVFNK